MILHLIRHGKTYANEQRLYCGQTDLPLSDTGAAEITQLARAGIYPARDGLKMYISGLFRTRQTLRLIYPDAAASPMPGLMEFHFGQFEMQTYEQLRHNPDYIKWITDETGEVSCPGGENKTTYSKRVDAALDWLISRNEPALVICHGGVITHIMQRLFPDEPRHFYDWQSNPGEGYTILWDECSTPCFTEIAAKAPPARIP